MFQRTMLMLLLLLQLRWDNLNISLIDVNMLSNFQTLYSLVLRAPEDATQTSFTYFCRML